MNNKYGILIICAAILFLCFLGTVNGAYYDNSNLKNEIEVIDAGSNVTAIDSRGRVSVVEANADLLSTEVWVDDDWAGSNPHDVMDSHIFGLPLSFEANQGQCDSKVKFLSHGNGYTMFLTPSEMVLTLSNPTIPQGDIDKTNVVPTTATTEGARSTERTVIRMKLVGANLEPQMTGLDELPGKNSYFIGNDPQKWHTNISHYARVKYHDVYPCVDLEITSQNGRLAQRLLMRDSAEVDGHSSLQNVRLRVEGVNNLTLDNDHLHITTARGNFTLPLLIVEGAVPHAQPSIINVKRGIFEVSSPFVSAHAFASVFAQDLPPSLSDDLLVYYSFDTYQGDTVTDESGSGNNGTVVGTLTHTSQGKFGGAYDFVKHNYITLDSNPTDGLTEFAVSLWFKTDTPTNNYKIASAASWYGIPDGSGWIVGTHYPEAWSEDGASIMVGHCPRNVSFVAGAWNHVVVSYDGVRFKEYINGQVSKDCATTGMPLGAGRNLEVGAWSQYSAYDYEGLIDEFRIYNRSLSADEVSLLYTSDYSNSTYSTYLGGSGSDRGYDLAVDSAGNVYITGETSSTDFPTMAGAYDTSYNGGNNDVFVTKLSADGSTLLYSTYVGGSSHDGSTGIVVDNAGNAYITGASWSTNFPTTDNALDITLNGGRDAFAVKLNATGDGLIYSTYIGGNSWDYGQCIAVDDVGKSYIGGFTHGDFPTTAGAFQTTFGGLGDGYVAKLNANGSELIYSTYLGGNSWENVAGIVVDNIGSAYVTSGTHSIDFPTTPGVWDETCDNCRTNYKTKGYVVKLNANGSALIYSTYLGSNKTPGGGGFSGIVIDRAGNVYVVGGTTISGFPTSDNALQLDFGGGSHDVVVTKLNANGSTLLYSTYLGGSGADLGYDIAIDDDDTVYVTGYTASTDFPTADPLQAGNGGGYDAFVAKLNDDDSALLYSTYLGGSEDENVNIHDLPNGNAGIAIDDTGNIYLTGSTTSTDFPTANPLQPNFGGGSYDAFVAKLMTPIKIWVDNDWANSSHGDVVDGHIFGIDAFARIHDGIDNATAGGTIIVRDGTYIENINVNKRLRIQSENGSVSTIVQAANSSDHVFKVTADYVNISGFIVKGASASYPYYPAGISVHYADYCNISNNIASNNYGGIHIRYSRENTLTGNTLGNNHDGIYLWDSCNNSITGNNVTKNNMYGFYLEGSSNNNIITGNNVCNNSRFGIYLGGSSSNTITDNTLSNNRYGIYLHRYSNNNIITCNTFVKDGLFVYKSYQNLVEDNIVNGRPLVYLEDTSDIVVTDAGQIILINCSNITVNNLDLSNTSVGVELWQTEDSIISNNNASSNDNEGIYLYDSSNNTVKANNISNNFYGIYIQDSCNNTITSNSVSDNNFNGIYIHDFSNNNTITSNVFVNNGLFVTFSYQNTVEDNTVNGKSLVYLEDTSDIEIADAGQVILVNCNNITVETLDLSNTSVGVELWQTEDSTIKNNNVRNNNFYGIFLRDSCNNNTITGNNVCSNHYGIDLYCSSNNNTITGNNVSNNDYYGICLHYSSNNNTITGNNVSNQRNGGIFLNRASSNILMNNICSYNREGICLYPSCNNNTLKNNTCLNNYYGIRLYESGNSNLIYLNNFMDNTDNVYSSSSGNIWNSTEEISYTYNGSTYTNYLGNYWSDYVFVSNDTNGDGIGDSSYVIPSDNNDIYPLMVPWVNYFAPTGNIFDTESSENPYPSLMGTHTGTITPSHNLTVSKLYTYPCAGTGGHTESIKLYENSTLIANGTWTGYRDDDWHNITLHNVTDGTSYVTLLQDHEYNYTIRTGSYPQILHATRKEVTGGTITCTTFVDANGNIYTDWIPAIRLEE